MGAALIHADGQTDRPDEPNSRLSRLSEDAWMLQDYIYYNSHKALSYAVRIGTHDFGP